MSAGRVAIITAGADGIGAATATAFAASGHRVVLVDIDKDALECGFALTRKQRDQVVHVFGRKLGQLGWLLGLEVIGEDQHGQHLVSTRLARERREILECQRR